MKKWTQYIGQFGYFSRYSITVSFYSINKTNTKHWYNIRILLTFLRVEYSFNYFTKKKIFVHLDREQLSKINGKWSFQDNCPKYQRGKIISSGNQCCLVVCIFTSNHQSLHCTISPRVGLLKVAPGSLVSRVINAIN